LEELISNKLTKSPLLIELAVIFGISYNQTADKARIYINNSNFGYFHGCKQVIEKSNA